MSPDATGTFPPKFKIPEKARADAKEQGVDLDAVDVDAEPEWVTVNGEYVPPSSSDPDPPAWSHLPSDRDGRFSGHDATATEYASGAAVEERDQGPLKPQTAAHSVLDVFRDGQNRTSYGASMEACGDFHARRRESTRLVERGFVRKEGTLPNPAPAGRKQVDAYVITTNGVKELERLGHYSKEVGL